METKNEMREAFISGYVLRENKRGIEQMERKKAEELYGKILLSTKQIRNEIMSEVADSISFGGEMSMEAAQELRNAARITGCAFDALMKRGVPVEPVEGKDDLVKMKLNDGDFVCSKKVMGIHESQTPEVKTKVFKEEILERPKVKVVEKVVIPEKLASETPKTEDTQAPLQKQEEPIPVRVNDIPKEEEKPKGSKFPWSAYDDTPKEEDVPEASFVEPLPETKTETFGGNVSMTEVVPENTGDNFIDEHRKHEDMFIFDSYRISVSHATSMQMEEMDVHIAPLTDFKGEEILSPPIIVSIFYKGKMASRSSYDNTNGRTMVQIQVGDYHFLCRGEFDEDGVFKSYINTTGASSDNGDTINIISCNKHGNPHNTGANHLRFHYVVDSDTNDIGVIEVFPLEIEEPEYIVMCRTGDYTDYYHVSQNQTGSGRRSVTIFEDNIKKELILNWDGKFMEAELLEV